MSNPEPHAPGAAETLESRVVAIVDQVRPYLQRDGGDVEFVGMEGKVVKLRLQGHCAGCPHAMMTLKSGIENFIREREPEVESVEAMGLTI
ncbi:MAG: NifU family protein [Candidatus Sumerlaeota bacterium]|nr:NifU family protein [Candidatus Sumerlaeota bacterium]